MAKDSKKYQEETGAATCFIHNTQFSHNATELKLRICKNNSSASHNMAIAMENCVL